MSCKLRTTNMILFRLMTKKDVTKQCAYFSSSQFLSNPKEHKKLKIQSPPPEDIKCDWVGPADSDSNLRQWKWYIPLNETKAQKQFRVLKEETHKWNQDYWTKHNNQFIKAKEEFIQKRLTELGPKHGDGTPRRLTAEELSKFYRSFLEENYNAHRKYNKDWYGRNISLLWPALKVNFEAIFRKR